MLMKSLLMIIVVFFVVLGPGVSAQQKDAEKFLEKGNKHYNKQSFEKARQFYFKALEADSNNVKANLYAGIELLESDEKWKSLPYIEKAYSIDPLADDQMDFYLGMAYQYNYEFKKALFHLEQAKKAPKKYNKEEWNEIHLRMEQCKTAISLKDADVKFNVENMGPEVNSPFKDYAPVVSPMQDKMILTSNRTEGKSKKYRRGEYFMNIYVVEKSDNNWKIATKMDKSLNSRYDDMGLSFDDEGKSLLVHNSSINNGDIFISDFNEGQWTKPVSLGENINTEKYIETSACLSPDGNSLYFTSNRSGGMGGMDIYVSYRNEDGSWGKAQNIGRDINTGGNEEAPFISADGNILFFSSDGHPGIGGLDVYYSIKDEKSGKWGKPSNMGFPVNTPQDDINFILAKDGLSGYYSATRYDSYGGEDIYKVSMLSGINENPSLLASFHKDAPGANPNNIFRRGNLFNDIDEVQVEAALVSNQQVKERNIKSQHLLRNVYFNMTETDIDSATMGNLDQVAAYMERYKGTKLELAGHTDDIGSENYNLSLSEERAEAVFQYLVDKGIAPSRLNIKAYGKTMPLASNDDEKEGRELNRRVEFNILPSSNDHPPVIGGSSYASNAN